MLTGDDRDCVARARELAPLIEAAAGRTETARKIPADILSAMHNAGLFHILLPASLGGGAADLKSLSSGQGHARTVCQGPFARKGRRLDAQ